MQRVVCDVGVVISGLLSPDGPPGRLLDLWREGLFDLVVSPLWLDELERVVKRPKITRYIDAADAIVLPETIVRQAVFVGDPPPQPGLTPDPGDDYVVALARANEADVIVSGDRHLLGLRAPEPPVVTLRAFVDDLER